jgi:2',3'-cyclic-nucleotide 2'-phosphodiesterase (5'-nucleotidase family)
VDGFKVGFFGICTHETAFLSYPGEFVTFASVEKTSQIAVNSLRQEGVDVIIALTHQSLTEDIALAK